MKIVALASLAILSAYGQPLPSGHPVVGNFKDVKMDGIIFKPPHIHTMPHTCKGEPDAVYGKMDGVYYACINGKEVCSEEKGAIPATLISNFDAAMREHLARMKETRERMLDGAPDIKTHNERFHAEVAQAMEETRAKMRQPYQPAGRSVPAGAISTVSTFDLPAGPAPAPAPKLADELVKGIAVGDARGDVLQKLGEPYMKVTGDIEYFTYLLNSGSTAELEFTKGKLARLRVVPGR